MAPLGKAGHPDPPGTKGGGVNPKLSGVGGTRAEIPEEGSYLTGQGGSGAQKILEKK